MECADFQSLTNLILASKNAEQENYLLHLRRKGQKGPKSHFDYGTMQVDPMEVLNSSESEEEPKPNGDEDKKVIRDKGEKVAELLRDFDSSFETYYRKALSKNKSIQTALANQRVAFAAAMANQASQSKQEKIAEKPKKTEEKEKEKNKKEESPPPRREEEKKPEPPLPQIEDKKEPESFRGRKDTYTSSHTRSYIASTVLRGGGPMKIYYFSTPTSITLNVPSKCKVSEAVKIFLFSYENDPSKDQSLVKYKNRPDCYELYFPDDDELHIPSNLPLAQDSELSEFDSLCFVLMENPEAQKIFSVQKTGTFGIQEMQKALRNKEVIYLLICCDLVEIENADQCELRGGELEEHLFGA
jgi:hypothetical protein